MSMIATAREAARFWGSLHAEDRFRPVFPDENVVRFLFRHYGRSLAAPLRGLDLGSGGGRHLKLLRDIGFEPWGLDVSRTGLAWTRSNLVPEAGLVQAGMTDLPFADERFDAIVSYGVFYYGRSRDMDRAIAEMRRVMRTGARALVILRTDRDHRYGKGAELEPDTFMLDIEDTNEKGTVQHFLSEDAVAQKFQAFRDLRFERVEATFGGRTHKNSDWIVDVQK